MFIFSLQFKPSVTLLPLVTLLVALLCCLSGTVVASATASATAGAEPTQEQQITTTLQVIWTGTEDEQKVASHRLWQIIRYEGIGKLPAETVVAQLSRAIREHKIQYVREFAVEALSDMKNELALPVLIEVLKDDRLYSYAYSGLRDLGARAIPAAPTLIEGINSGRLGGGAFEALAAIVGKDSVPIILRAIEKPNANKHWRHDAASVFHNYPHPSAAAFMARELYSKTDPGTPLRAALFFSTFDNAASLAHMRFCLNYQPIHDQARDLWVPEFVAADIREVATRYLGVRRDKASYGRIVQLLQSDPDMNVRTAAATALGEYGNPQDIPGLAATFKIDDGGFEAEGHVSGSLHQAALTSLSKIGTDEALEAIYNALFITRTRRLSQGFWQDSKHLPHLHKFLGFYKKRPVESRLAAPIVESLLQTHRATLELKGKELAQAKEDFLAHVQDEKHFSKKSDLGQSAFNGIDNRIGIHNTFYEGGFAVVSFTFDSHGYTLLYRKIAGQWLPLDRVSEWVS